MKRYKILKIEINDLWCYEFQPHVMGSPLKHGSINLLLDRKPKFKYKQVGNFFFAKDCGLASIYELRKGTTEAFGGAKFDVPMKDGSIYRATGDLWDPFDTTPFSKLLDFNLCRIGYSTPKDYKECPVYCGCYADTKMITNQLLYRLSYLGFCVFNINFAIFVPHPIFQSCIILHLFAVMSDFLSDFVYHLQKG